MREIWMKSCVIALFKGVGVFALCALTSECAPAPRTPQSLSVASSAAPPSVPTPRRALLALSKAAHSLAIVDSESLRVIARVPVGPDPHEVIATSDGRTAFVSNTGGGSFHQLSVVDLIGQRALPEIDTGALLGPHGLTFSGGRVWFTAEGAKAVARYDPAAGRFDWVLGTGQDRTHMLFVTADEKRVYATNVDSGTVSLIEQVVRPPPIGPNGVVLPGAQARLVWEETVVPASPGVEGFDVTPDGRELWTASARDGTVFVVDLAAKKVTATIDAKALGANRLKFTPDGALALISSLRTGDLLVLNVAKRSEAKRIPLGRGAAGMLIDPQTPRVFVACTADDYVAVVDLKTLTVTARIDVGGKPDGLAWAVR